MFFFLTGVFQAASAHDLREPIADIITPPHRHASLFGLEALRRCPPHGQTRGIEVVEAALEPPANTILPQSAGFSFAFLVFRHHQRTAFGVFWSWIWFVIKVRLALLVPFRKL